MDIGQDMIWDLEDEEEDMYFTIAFSFVLFTVFEFSFVSLHSLYLFESHQQQL